MNLYFKAAVNTFKDIVKFLGVLLGFIGVFAFNFFMITRYVYKISESFPEASVFLVGLLSYMLMAIEIALVMGYLEKVKELKKPFKKSS